MQITRKMYVEVIFNLDKKEVRAIASRDMDVGELTLLPLLVKPKLVSESNSAKAVPIWVQMGTKKEDDGSGLNDSNTAVAAAGESGKRVRVRGNSHSAAMAGDRSLAQGRAAVAAGTASTTASSQSKRQLRVIKQESPR